MAKDIENTYALKNRQKMRNKPIPTYIINLPKRKERKTWILNQFNGRTEFNLTLIEAREDSTGSLGL